MTAATIIKKNGKSSKNSTPLDYRASAEDVAVAVSATTNGSLPASQALDAIGQHGPLLGILGERGRPHARRSRTTARHRRRSK